jgi:antitoxin component YwqK of YwqJK toxin-antitoxin module
MKKTLSILLLLCMAFATAFAVVSCGKAQSKDKLSPEERAAVDEVMKSLYSAPEKKDEGVYEENEYGIATTYKYDKNRNLVKVYRGKATAILEYDEKDRLAKVSVKNAEGKSTATYVMTYTDRGFISEIAGEIANDETQYSRKTSFVYDEKDRVIKNEVVQSDETVQLIEVTYDEKARVITMTGNWEHSKTGFKAVATYNEDWKAIKNERFDENGTPVYVTEFDGNGNTIRSTNYDENGKPSWSYGYEYDEDGKKIKETSYKEDGSISMIYRYEYDEKGNITKEARYDETETLRAYEVYEYDENGYVLKMTQYSAGGVKTGYTEYFENTTYANKYAGRRRTESYFSDGSLSYIYEYNKNGETTKSEDYRNGKLWSAEEYEYDESGNLIKSSSYDADRKFTSYSVYGYNESGKRIKISKYDGSGTLTEYTEIKRNGDYILSETVYDADGNKTKYTEYLENTPDYNTYSRTKRYEKYENGKLAELREYNEDGKTLKSSSYKNGSLESYSNYHYNESGRLIKVTACDAYNRIVNYYEIEYTDENGNGKTHEYDKNGNLLGTYPWVIFR